MFLLLVIVPDLEMMGRTSDPFWKTWGLSFLELGTFGMLAAAVPWLQVWSERSRESTQ